MVFVTVVVCVPVKFWIIVVVVVELGVFPDLLCLAQPDLVELPVPVEASV